MLLSGYRSSTTLVTLILKRRALIPIFCFVNLLFLRLCNSASGQIKPGHREFKKLVFKSFVGQADCGGSRVAVSVDSIDRVNRAVTMTLKDESLEAG